MLPCLALASIRFRLRLLITNDRSLFSLERTREFGADLHVQRRPCVGRTYERESIRALSRRLVMSASTRPVMIINSPGTRPAWAAT